MEPKLVDLDLWDDIMMGYETSRKHIAVLFEPVDVPGQEKALILRQTPQSAYRNAFEYMMENLINMGEFCPELYLAIPYLVKIFEKWQQKNDFEWQLLFLTAIGDIVSNDVPSRHYSASENKITGEMIDSYSCSIEIMKEKAKKFVLDNMERLKQLSQLEVSYFCWCLLALVGDREEACVIDHQYRFADCELSCPNCGEIDYSFFFDEEGTIQRKYEKLQLAPSVIGQWDQKSFDDTYLWFSNLLHLLGDDKDAKTLTYYYGTCTCPECGRTDNVMEFAKIGLTE